MFYDLMYTEYKVFTVPYKAENAKDLEILTKILYANKQKDYIDLYNGVFIPTEYNKRVINQILNNLRNITTNGSNKIPLIVDNTLLYIASKQGVREEYVNDYTKKINCTVHDKYVTVYCDTFTDIHEVVAQTLTRFHKALAVKDAEQLLTYMNKKEFSKVANYKYIGANFIKDDCICIQLPINVFIDLLKISDEEINAIPYFIYNVYIHFSCLEDLIAGLRRENSQTNTYPNYLDIIAKYNSLVETLTYEADFHTFTNITEDKTYEVMDDTVQLILSKVNDIQDLELKANTLGYELYTLDLITEQVPLGIYKLKDKNKSNTEW